MGLKLSGGNIDHDKIVKSLGARYKLVPHLDMAIGEGEFEWDAHFEAKASDDAWHPSGDCTPSLHELYLKASGRAEPENIPVTLRKIFIIGHFYHQYFQWIVEHKLGFAGSDDIERRGLHVWGRRPHPAHLSAEPVTTTTTEGTLHVEGGVHRWEGSPRPYHWATGSGDIAPCKIPGVGEFAIDFKTMNPRMFATGPSPEYMAKWECQGNIYLDFFDMERILFVGVDKSNGEMKEWEFHRNQPLIDAIYDKWKLVSECLDAEIEPPVDEPWPLPLKGPAE